MELNQVAHKASNFAPEDFISNMPDNVITNILDRLPTQDAVRTGILSRNWRFKWSQLIFDEEFYIYLSERDQEINFERIISRLLLNIKGTLTKFFLYIADLCNEEDFAHWILFLSRKGVKDLTIWKSHFDAPEVPTHLFSCLELKHLKLSMCHFDPPANFHGFPHLLSLELGHVEFESKKFEKFFAQCHGLENLSITSCEGKVKLVEIAKLTSLKILSLSLCNLDNTMISSIFDLVGFLPKLQELCLNILDVTFTQNGARKMSPTAFSCLKTLKFININLRDGIMLSFAFDIIRSSPNLQTLEINSSYRGADPRHAIVDYNSMGLLQLRSVVFTNVKGLENEVCLIENLLVCSPLLRKVVIHPHSTLGSDEKLMFAMKLLELHRASPVAEIKLK